jgi:hypothetical protein
MCECAKHLQEPSVDRLSIRLESESPGTWRWHKGTVRGTIKEFSVVDANYGRHIRCKFQVRVPRGKGDYVTVVPSGVPALKAMAGMDRRSASFARCHRQLYLGKAYHPIAVCSPSLAKNFRRMSRGSRGLLPRWLRGFTIRLKKTVTHADGNDRNQQVVVVRREDWRKMIWVYFAEKIWPVREGFPLPS